MGQGGEGYGTNSRPVLWYRQVLTLADVEPTTCRRTLNEVNLPGHQAGWYQAIQHILPSTRSRNEQ